MAKALPAAPSLEHFKKQAKDLLTAFRSGNTVALALFKHYHPDCAILSAEAIAALPITLTDSQLVLARDYAFPSWPKLKAWIDEFHHPLRSAWVAAIQSADIPAVHRLLQTHPAFANSAHIEFDDPWRAKRFPTATLDYVAAGPFPQTLECGAANAARTANLDLLHLLLDSGANPDTDTHHGSCLGWLGDPQVAALLVRCGAPLNHWNPNGGSPLNFTCWSNAPERTRLLLTLGADPRLADPITGETCLHYAADTNAGECLRLLLDAGAAPNARCISNPTVSSSRVLKHLPETPLVAETPLHRAALAADLPAIETLLAHHADPTLQTIASETPHVWAQRAHRSSEILTCLQAPY